jgi:group I intron endonuclease
MIINLVNGKIYIGKANNLRRRIQSHLCRCRKMQIIDNAIKKYGAENFTLLVLAEFEQVNNLELLALETAFIEYFNSTNPKVGYNICLFSNDTTGVKVSEETKRKMSDKRKGRVGPFLGKHHSEESKKKTSEKLLGSKKPFGHAMGNKNPNFGKYGENSPNRKSVQQINKNTGKIIKTWPSIIDACRTLNLDNGGIVMVLKGKNKSCGNFQWKYL